MDNEWLIKIPKKRSFEEIRNLLTDKELDLAIFIYYEDKFFGTNWVSLSSFETGNQLLKKGVVSNVESRLEGVDSSCTYTLHDYFKSGLEQAPRSLVYKICSRMSIAGDIIENLRKEAFIETAKKEELVPYLTDADIHIRELAKQRFKELTL
jgi:hypothetical protein